MAWSGTVATLNDCLYKAGAGVSSTSGTEAYGNSYVLQGEAYVIGVVNYDVVTNWASLDSKLKYVITEYVSAFVATHMILYSMAGYTSRSEAQTMLNVLWARMDKCEALMLRLQVAKKLGA